MLSLGGTISAVPHPAGGVTPTADPQWLRTMIADAASGISGLPEPLLMQAETSLSAALELPTLIKHARLLRRLAAQGSHGVVVMTGTDTLEEVAFLFDLLWDRPEPLVVVGAMRHPQLLGYDGLANLQDALRIAASPSARSRGCVVVMDSTVHLAWQVRKTHTSRLGAFASPISGPVGAITEGIVRFSGGTAIDRPLFELEEPAATPPVALVSAALGDDGRALGAILDSGYAGLVVETMGGGSVPPRWVPHLASIAATIPTVYASRTDTGPTLQGTYGGEGSERQLRAIGLTPSGLLDGLKARLLLSLLLASSASRSTMLEAWSLFDVPQTSGRRLRVVPTHRAPAS